MQLIDEPKASLVTVVDVCITDCKNNKTYHLKQLGGKVEFLGLSDFIPRKEAVDILIKANLPHDCIVQRVKGVTVGYF